MQLVARVCQRQLSYLVRYANNCVKNNAEIQSLAGRANKAATVIGTSRSATAIGYLQRQS